jgi:xanthine/uracil permease
MFHTLGKLVKLALMTVGLATLLFVFVSYGWNGEPPTVELD